MAKAKKKAKPKPLVAYLTVEIETHYERDTQRAVHLYRWRAGLGSKGGMIPLASIEGQGRRPDPEEALEDGKKFLKRLGVKIQGMTIPRIT